MPTAQVYECEDHHQITYPSEFCLRALDEYYVCPSHKRVLASDVVKQGTAFFHKNCGKQVEFVQIFCRKPLKLKSA